MPGVSCVFLRVLLSPSFLVKTNQRKNKYRYAQMGVIDFKKKMYMMKLYILSICPMSALACAVVYPEMLLFNSEMTNLSLSPSAVVIKRC